jgi:hypothetical protein
MTFRSRCAQAWRSYLASLLSDQQISDSQTPTAEQEISALSSLRLWTVDRIAPAASTVARNQGSASSGRRVRPMLLLPELDAPWKRMTRPRRNVYATTLATPMT